MKAYEALARALLDSGVDHLFGLIGDANMDHVAKYVEAGRGRYIGAVDERGATSMADGFARAGGRVGVVTVTHGPGAANTVNPVVEAVRAHSPLLLLTGDTPAARGHAQSIDLRALFSATGASYRLVSDVAHLVDELRSAIEQVTTTRTPLVLNIPVDVQNKDVDYMAPSLTSVARTAPRLDEDSLDAALGVVATARRPLVVAGQGAVSSGAGRAIAELADLLQAPLATTASGKDLFFGHPYDLGIIGSLGHPWAVDVMAKADCVIAFGAGLNPNTTVDGGLLEDRALIQCDLYPERIGQWTAPTVAIHGDANDVAMSMVQQLNEIEFRPSGSFRATEMGQGVSERSPYDDYVDESNDRTLDMRTAAIALQEMLPADKVLVSDTGRFVLPTWRYLHVQDSDTFIHTLSWSSIGLGIATAIGAAFASPERPTVALVGDGGAMMGMIELATAVQHQVPVVVVVFNDGAYGAEYVKLQQHGLDPRHSLLGWPSLADVARALGAHSVTARSVAELKAAVSDLTPVTGPVVIEVHADPTVNPAM